ncbi:MAG TPA: hypothetical protein VMU50_18485 [Polyangia bacterium]|nr:hypothetical protein [Polyangia bacterium]
MAATEVFKMNNPNSTCTAAALTWSYMLLSGSAKPRADLFLPRDPTLARNMENIKDDDGNPERQVALMQLEPVKKNMGPASISSSEIAELFKNNAPHVGIFWNSFHTVGYSYGHLDKQYFDNNVGLYRANHTKDIVAKMDEIRKANGYGNWAGYIVCKLKPRLKLT